MSNNILAVVVTYNRLELLKRCIEALNNQTINNFDILIVNNGSTDGTKEWIDSLDNTILKIHQKNLGGAGGFYTGQRYGFDNGYEWVWMMDDDGVPAENQLEILLNTCTTLKIKFANPLVVDINDPTTICENRQSIDLYDGLETTTDFSSPFNGTFINKDVFDKIGFVKKEMFIWGDEVEYRQRAKVNGYNLVTIIKAIHRHPPMKSIVKRALPFCKKFNIKVKPKHFSKYYYRNLGYFNHTYASSKVLIVDLFCYSIYHLRMLDIKEFAKFLKYYYSGIRNQFD